MTSVKEKEKITKANYPLTSRVILNELNEYGVPGTDIITEAQTLFPEIDRFDPKYEKDGDGNLTQYGSDELKFDKLVRKENMALYKVDSGRLTSFLLGRLSLASQTILEINKEFIVARQKSDTFKIWALLKSTHFYGTGATKNTQLTKFISIKQGSAPLEDHLLEFQQQTILFKGNYESKIHPGFIAIEDITRNTWLNSVDQAFYQTKIDHVLDNTPDALTADVIAAFQLYNLQRGDSKVSTHTSDYTTQALLAKDTPGKNDKSAKTPRPPLPDPCPPDYCEHCWLRGYAFYSKYEVCRSKPKDWKPPVKNEKALVCTDEDYSYCPSLL